MIGVTRAEPVPRSPCNAVPGMIGDRRHSRLALDLGNGRIESPMVLPREDGIRTHVCTGARALVVGRPSRAAWALQRPLRHNMSGDPRAAAPGPNRRGVILRWRQPLADLPLRPGFRASFSGRSRIRLASGSGLSRVRFASASRRFGRANQVKTKMAFSFSFLGN